ncbi:hypothetical protein [Pseudorhodoferax sp.]|uniref:hypothetical protein n=1 Tax=Pseudorhodoferax sp. TaxID=1993553 RepID=UPI002DD65F2D|nr:hypothetical protein [Pseudorhodoferax sp.]
MLLQVSLQHGHRGSAVAAQLMQAGRKVHAPRKRRHHLTVAQDGTFQQRARGRRLLQIQQDARTKHVHHGYEANVAHGPGQLGRLFARLQRLARAAHAPLQHTTRMQVGRHLHRVAAPGSLHLVDQLALGLFGGVHLPQFIQQADPRAQVAQ